MRVQPGSGGCNIRRCGRTVAYDEVSPLRCRGFGDDRSGQGLEPAPCERFSPELDVSPRLISSLLLPLYGVRLLDSGPVPGAFAISSPNRLSWALGVQFGFRPAAVDLVARSIYLQFSGSFESSKALLDFSFAHKYKQRTRPRAGKGRGRPSLLLV